MDAPPPLPDPLHSPSVSSSAATDAAGNDSPMGELPPPSDLTVDGPKSTTIKPKKRNKKKKLPLDGSDALLSSSTSSFCCTSHYIHRGVRVASKQRNPRVLIGSARHKEGDVEALALPLGMSIAAVVAQVLERKNNTGEIIAVNHLSEICTLAVRESLANVFGDKFDSFVMNFEKSFRSTLMTLRLVNESSHSSGEHPRHLSKESTNFDMIHSLPPNDECFSTCTSGVTDCQSEVIRPTIISEEHFGSLEETERNARSDSVTQALALHDGEINQQLACVSCSAVNQSMFSTFEKSVIEQTRSNDLKTFEISLAMKKLQLKEKQLALHLDLNFLERCKLRMGISRASFKADKFKTELEETRHAELLKKCIDCLVAGLLIMLASVGYGTYVYSHNRITEATGSCAPSEEPKSWWVPKPMSSFNSGLQIIWCHVQVISRMLFGLLMILAIAYLLVQRSSVSTQTMPVTFILLLGVACGFAGKLCIDTLGGSGYHWLLYWEVLCLLHLFSTICTSILFVILHGPVTVSQGGNGKTRFPYWIRRSLFYAVMLVFLPMLCGLIPFASPAEWKDHFLLRAMDFLQAD